MRSTLQYKSLNSYDKSWRDIRINEGFCPRDDDFEYIVFRINGIEYTEPSETFYTEYNKALMWIKLQTENDDSFMHLGMKFGYSDK